MLPEQHHYHSHLTSSDSSSTTATDTRNNINIIDTSSTSSSDTRQAVTATPTLSIDTTTSFQQLPTTLNNNKKRSTTAVTSATTPTSPPRKVLVISSPNYNSDEEEEEDIDNNNNTSLFASSHHSNNNMSAEIIGVKRKADDESAMDDHYYYEDPAHPSSNARSSHSPSRQQSGRVTTTPAKRLRLVWTVDDTHSRSPSPSPHHLNNDSHNSHNNNVGRSLHHQGSPSHRPRRSLDDPQEIVLPINRILETLQKEDLVNILNLLIGHHPGLEGPVASLIPRPTVTSATEHLKQAQARLHAAFPYARTGGNSMGQDRSSDYAYNRVRPHLAALMELFSVYLTYFTEPTSCSPESSHEYPTIAFGFLKVATRLCLNLPAWNNPEHHSETRGQVWAWVSQGWASAVREVCRRGVEEGRMFAASVVGGWYQDLQEVCHASVAEDPGSAATALLIELVDEFVRSLGWIIGVRSSPFQQQHIPQPSMVLTGFGVMGDAASSMAGFGFGLMSSNSSNNNGNGNNANDNSGSSSAFSFFPMVSGH